jgi:hypothetical protein
MFHGAYAERGAWTRYGDELITTWERPLGAETGWPLSPLPVCSDRNHTHTHTHTHTAADAVMA